MKSVSETGKLQKLQNPILIHLLAERIGLLRPLSHGLSEVFEIGRRFDERTFDYCGCDVTMLLQFQQVGGYELASFPAGHRIRHPRECGENGRVICQSELIHLLDLCRSKEAALPRRQPLSKRFDGDREIDFPLKGKSSLLPTIADMLGIHHNDSHDDRGYGTKSLNPSRPSRPFHARPGYQVVARDPHHARRNYDAKPDVPRRKELSNCFHKEILP